MRTTTFAVPLLIAALFGDARAQSTTTVVSGVAYDSLAFRGLGDATVQLMTLGATSTVRTAKTDASGNFEFQDVPFGSYLVGFFHSKLDSLGLTGETARVDIRVARPVTVQLSIPAARTIARRVCGKDFPTEDVGLLVGHVRGANDSRVRGGAKLDVRWADIVFERGAVRREISMANATASDVGLFAICGLPLNVPVLLRVSAGADSSGQFELTLPRSFTNRDVYVAPVRRERVAAADSMPDAELLRGNGRLRGKVIGENKRTVADARVTVWGTGYETVTTADGEFSLANLPVGTHTLEVRAIGFMPTQIPVDVLEENARADIELAAIAITLDTVRVTAQRAFVSHRMLEIERRQRSGMGQVLLAADIDKRNPFRVSDILRTMRGVRTIPGRFSSEIVVMRGKLGSGHCMPQFIIDNARVQVDQDFPIDAFVQVNDIVAVEVYSMIVPADFVSSNNCGVVAITTGRTRGRGR